MRDVVLLFGEARGIRSSELVEKVIPPLPEAGLSDDAFSSVREVLLADAQKRIDFAELDLEHLGTFYEGLMPFDSLEGRIHYDVSSPVDPRHAPGDERRRLGAHYTSPVITRIVVERALAPLLRAATSPDQILDLRICDPAMGSGAFLLEVCRQLSTELVRAWERTGDATNAYQGQDMTLHARRLVAENCLYGVDKNPRAVELARWTLWLATASPDAPGVFLNEHLRVGDSLIGRPGGSKWFFESLPASKRVIEFQHRRRPFHWDLEFAAVLERGGFDAFVGNPPWVSFAGRAAQPLDKDLRAYYADTNPAFRGYRNLQGLFLARCAEMLKPSGRLGFVLPSSMSELAGYAPTRMAHDSLCECDEDLPDFGDVFDDVFQPSMALLSTRRPEPIVIENPRVWSMHRTDLDAAAVALRDRLLLFPTFPPELFGERGFQSVGDDVQHLHQLDAPSGEFRVAVRVGGDMDAFLCRPPKLYCDPTSFGARFRPEADWQNVALLIRQTARFPIAALSDGQAFRNSILAGFASSTWSRFFLLAWLNASPIRWFHYVCNRDARQGMPQVKIAHLRALPAPRSPEAVPPIEELGRQLGLRNAGISASEQAILDALVADALELGPSERQIIQTWAVSMMSKSICPRERICSTVRRCTHVLGFCYSFSSRPAPVLRHPPMRSLRRLLRQPQLQRPRRPLRRHRLLPRAIPTFVSWTRPRNGRPVWANSWRFAVKPQKWFINIPCSRRMRLPAVLRQR